MSNNIRSGITLHIIYLTAGAIIMSCGTNHYKDKAGIFVTMQTTLGDFTLELDGEKAPLSTFNFLQYAESGFYNGTIFHRVMPGFMIQGGGFSPEMDLKQTGIRKPIKNEWENGLKNITGSISMARTSDPDSATSQFFINTVDNSFLDDPVRNGGAAYAVFGKVIEGMDIIKKIEAAKCMQHPKYPGGSVSPVTPVIIKKTSVTGVFNREILLEKTKKAGLEMEAEKIRRQKDKESEFANVLSEIESQHKKKFTTTASGLRWLEIKSGKGKKPSSPSATVKVHYEGKLVNGTVFDSSYARGEPISFALNQVIPGWTEGVSMMKEGSKRVLFIPPELGYGAGGAGPIPPNSWLIFTVELIAIQ